MCSIVGSYSKEKFLELIKLNTYRGTFSHSLTIIKANDQTMNKDGVKRTITRNFGEFDESLLDSEYYEAGDYLLGHGQSPTNGLIQDKSRIHPYVGHNDNMLLLHNGIIKDADVDRLNEVLGQSYVWDTQALAEYIYEDFQKLSDIEGSFACCCIKNDELFMFRNAISPLYMDGNANISSTKFVDSNMIDNNAIYQLDIKNKVFNKVGTFNNTHNPYYF